LFRKICPIHRTGIDASCAAGGDGGHRGIEVEWYAQVLGEMIERPQRDNAEGHSGVRHCGGDGIQRTIASPADNGIRVVGKRATRGIRHLCS
jgi:hypothetical protein